VTKILVYDSAELIKPIKCFHRARLLLGCSCLSRVTIQIFLMRMIECFITGDIYFLIIQFICVIVKFKCSSFLDISSMPTKCDGGLWFSKFRSKRCSREPRGGGQELWNTATTSPTRTTDRQREEELIPLSRSDQFLTRSGATYVWNCYDNQNNWFDSRRNWQPPKSQLTRKSTWTLNDQNTLVHVFARQV